MHLVPVYEEIRKAHLLLFLLAPLLRKCVLKQALVEIRPLQCHTVGQVFILPFETAS